MTDTLHKGSVKNNLVEFVPKNAKLFLSKPISTGGDIKNESDRYYLKEYKNED